jgi:hypothetical protein
MSVYAEDYSSSYVEGVSLLKNYLGTGFRSTLGTKRADFGAFRARIVVATSSMPTFFNTLVYSANFAFTSTRFAAQPRSATLSAAH